MEKSYQDKIYNFEKDRAKIRKYGSDLINKLSNYIPNFCMCTSTNNYLKIN